MPGRGEVVTPGRGRERQEGSGLRARREPHIVPIDLDDGGGATGEAAGDGAGGERDQALGLLEVDDDVGPDEVEHLVDELHHLRGEAEGVEGGGGGGGDGGGGGGGGGDGGGAGGGWPGAAATKPC